jgi:deazaflavin-dependent oxidoreductase (nitroreductase family)
VWYFTPSPTTLTWITRIHRALYLATSGILGSSLPQLEPVEGRTRLCVLTVALLTTTGRKSGALRTVPLPYFVYEGRTLLIASFAASERDPAWYQNLLAHPEVGLRLRSERRRCRAVTLVGAERERFWKLITHDWPRYALYQRRMRREIPLVELVAI